MLVAAMLAQLAEPLGNCMGCDGKLDQEARVLLEDVVCQGGSEKAGAQIAGEPVCEGALVEVHIAAEFARVSAELQRVSAELQRTSVVL